MTVIEHTMFILELDKINKFNRIYPAKIVQKWIDQLIDNTLPYYEIEYIGENNINNFLEESIRTPFNCGKVTNLYIEDKKLYGSIKLKVNNPNLKQIYENKDILNEMTIVPKTSLMCVNNVVTECDLIGFNLIYKVNSPFL